MALHRMAKRSNDIPHIPFYKDEKVIGKRVTVSVSLRVFLLSLVLFVLTMGFVAFRLIDDQAQFQKLVNVYHQSRLDDQVQTDRKIKGLACGLVVNYADSVAPLIAHLRDEYGCAPYKVTSAPKKPAVAATTVPKRPSPAKSVVVEASPSQTPAIAMAPSVSSRGDGVTQTPHLSGDPGVTQIPSAVTVPRTTHALETHQPPSRTVTVTRSSSVPTPMLSLPSLPPILNIGGSCVLNVLGLCLK